MSFPASPLGHCHVARAWDESFAAFPKSGYFAPVDSLPAAIRPRRSHVAADDGKAACFDRPWPKPALF
jgi:hypothetical protein